MKYKKPTILRTYDAHACIEGQDKAQDLVDSNQPGVQGTIGAYQADE